MAVRRNARRGNTLVLGALFIVILFGMAAFAIDVGYIVEVRTELQRVADACALAGAAYLPDEYAAQQAIFATDQENHSGNLANIATGDIEFGYWDRDTGTFTSPAPSGFSTNAVRVTANRAASHGNSAALFFAPLLGIDATDLTASAVAMYDYDACGPFVGIEWVDVGGTADMDSYRSQDGAYGGSNVYDRGGVCSDGPVKVHGNPIIRGDARAGRGYQVTMTGNATVTGSVGSRLKPLNMPPVDASEAATSNDNSSLPLIPSGNGNSWKSPVNNQGDFTLNAGEIYDFPPGTYYFRDMSLAGGAVVNFSGPTEIYVTRKLSRTGGAIVNNNTLSPVNLRIYMTGGSANITSHDVFHGVLYGPNTDITINGSAEYFGVVVGKTLKVTGTSGAHYDESLGANGVNFARRSSLVD